MAKKKAKLPVQCPACLKDQEDRGVDMSCTACGAFPLPSYYYKAKSVFHPNTPAKPYKQGANIGRPTALQPKKGKKR